jgi:putative transposase
MSRSTYRIIENSRPYFLTCTIVNWLPLFSNPEIADIVLGSLRFLQSSERLTLYAYVLMEHHLHLIASAGDLSKEIHDFKSFTAHNIVEYLEANSSGYLLGQLRANKAAHKVDRTYQVWQEGSHLQLIKDAAMMRQKLQYIHHNPVKRGYIDEPEHWQYSSARNYEGKKGVLDICNDW